MERHLAAITSSLQAMQALLSRMGERCDPYVYYKRVRVPMSGQDDRQHVLCSTLTQSPEVSAATAAAANGYASTFASLLVLLVLAGTACHSYTAVTSAVAVLLICRLAQQ
jgi:hypothetical protein